MQTPIESAAALTIGTVESVSPSEIWVLLDTDAPQATALNAGTPIGFPRINGYVLIPNETGAVVGMIVWLGVERSAFPKRPGMKDFGLIDLPYPLRKLKLTPLGTLVQRMAKGTYSYRLERGVSAFPSVGDPASLPTETQLRSIIEAPDEADQRVTIGTSPLTSSARVTVDPNKVFGRHLAVLGNTGSGKSCTVAGLIRWSIEQARIRRLEANKDDFVNARFIVLDPNGEYSSAFSDITSVRRFRVPPPPDNFKSLTVPMWMWNSHEWCALSEAKSGVQRPLLMRALRELRQGVETHNDEELMAALFLRSCHRSLIGDRARGIPAFVDKPGRNDFGQKLHAMAVSIESYSAKIATHGLILQQLSALLKSIADSKLNSFDNNGERVEYYKPFVVADVDRTISELEKVIEILPVPERNSGTNEDSPIQFKGEDLIALVETLAAAQGQSQYVETLLLRIKMLLNDQRMRPMVSPSTELCLNDWLAEVVGQSLAKNGSLSIIDLSLISSDILHIVIAVIARLIYESIQRYRRLEGEELPTVIVLEEAHSFIHRGSESNDGVENPTQMCRQTFERIAREGRKFGLGLVLSSQRPSELSPTVLAQCNTFLLHRIVNDRDQELVGKLVPDNLGGLLKELPSLPSRQAILLGWAAQVPVLVEINELPTVHRPKSADPKFWEVWTGCEERFINWKKIVEDWTGTTK